MGAGQSMQAFPGHSRGLALHSALWDHPVESCSRAKWSWAICESRAGTAAGTRASRARTAAWGSPQGTGLVLCPCLCPCLCQLLCPCWVLCLGPEEQQLLLALRPPSPRAVPSEPCVPAACCALGQLGSAHGAGRLPGDGREGKPSWSPWQETGDSSIVPCSSPALLGPGLSLWMCACVPVSLSLS